MPYDLIKRLPPPFLDAIYDTFRVFLRHRRVFDSLKHSTTVLLHKGGPATDLDNFRPIALGESTYKFFTAILTDLMSSFAEDNGVLSESQEGFRKHRSCERRGISR